MISKKILLGDVDPNSDPLLYYRNKLKRMDNPVKIIGKRPTGPEDSQSLDFEDLSFGPKIGAGGYGEVYKGKWKYTDVAIKRVFKNQNEGDIDNFMKEIAILRQAQSF